ncbi:hypothetical protein JST97_11215 [bacterium]|nr:hypothetical protein [bacterium]
MSEVDGLIQSLHREGVLTSEGQFTISLERAAAARKKLLQVSPAWPYLQLVRQAYRLGGSVQLDRRSNYLGFRLRSSSQPDWWAAVNWLAQRPVDKPDSLVLAEVTLALIASGAERLELVLTGEFDNAKLTWGGHSNHLDLWGFCPDPTQLHLSVFFPKSGWFQAGPDYLGRVVAEVGQRCRHSTQPVRVGDELVNDANWTTLPGLSYLEPDVAGFEHAVEELELGGRGFIAPSTRVVRPREFLVNDYSLVTPDSQQCNALMVSLRISEKGTISRFNSYGTLPGNQCCIPLHPQLLGERAASQDFLLTERDCLSRVLARNCGYVDLQTEAAAYLEVSRRLIFPLRAPFVGQICVIQEGVALQSTDCDLGIPGCVAIVHDPQLLSDADGLKVVLDARWEVIRQQLRQRFSTLAGLLRQRLADPHLTLPPELRKDLEERLQ